MSVADLKSSNIPEVFLQRLKQQFPDDYPALITTFHRPLPVIRINSLLTNYDQTTRELEKEGLIVSDISELPSSLRVLNADRKRITQLLAYQEGRIYLQSAASQLVVKVLHPQPNERILDLCAAPGSKTSQIAILMGCQGELVANEPKRERFFRLISNVRLQKLDQFVMSKQYLGERYGDYYPEHFDKVLVDAPCSSESRFVDGDIKTTRYWSRHKVKAFARLQRKLLASAIRCTKPGGLIVYSTCTYSPEENELMIDWALRKHPEICLEDIIYPLKRLSILSQWNGKSLNPSLQKTLRLFPNENQEAFFMALIRKK